MQYSYCSQFWIYKDFVFFFTSVQWPQKVGACLISNNTTSTCCYSLCSLANPMELVIFAVMQNYPNHGAQLTHKY